MVGIEFNIIIKPSTFVGRIEISPYPLGPVCPVHGSRQCLRKKNKYTWKCQYSDFELIMSTTTYEQWKRMVTNDTSSSRIKYMKPRTPRRTTGARGAEVRVWHNDKTNYTQTPSIWSVVRVVIIGPRRRSRSYGNCTPLGL